MTETTDVIDERNAVFLELARAYFEELERLDPLRPDGWDGLESCEREAYAMAFRYIFEIRRGLIVDTLARYDKELGRPNVVK
jgi:hypothetical protein